MAWSVERRASGPRQVPHREPSGETMVTAWGTRFIPPQNPEPLLTFAARPVPPVGVVRLAFGRRAVTLGRGQRRAVSRATTTAAPAQHRRTADGVVAAIAASRGAGSD